MALALSHRRGEGVRIGEFFLKITDFHASKRPLEESVDFEFGSASSNPKSYHIIAEQKQELAPEIIVYIGLRKDLPLDKIRMCYQVPRHIPIDRF